MEIIIFIFCGIIQLAQGKNKEKLYEKTCMGNEDAIEYAKSEEWKQLNKYYQNQKTPQEHKEKLETCMKFNEINRFLNYCNYLKGEKSVKGFTEKSDINKPEFVGGIRKTLPISDAMKQIVEAAYKTGRLCLNIEDEKEYAKTEKWQHLEKYEQYQPTERQKLQTKSAKIMNPQFGTCMHNYASINSFLKYCAFLSKEKIKEGFNEKKFKFIAVRPDFVYDKKQTMPILEAMKRSVNATRQIEKDYNNLCVDIGEEKEYAKTDKWQHLADKWKHLENEYGPATNIDCWKTNCNDINAFLNYCDFLKGEKITNGSTIIAMRPKFTGGNGQKMPIMEAMKQIVVLTYEELNVKLCRGIGEATEFSKTNQWQQLKSQQLTVPVVKFMKDYKEINRFLEFCNYLKGEKIAENFNVKESEIFAGKPKFVGGNEQPIPIKKAMQKIVETANEVGKKLYEKFCIDIGDAAQSNEEWKKAEIVKRNSMIYLDWETALISINRFLKYCNFLKKNERSRKWDPDYAEREYEHIALKPQFMDSTIRDAMAMIVEVQQKFVTEVEEKARKTNKVKNYLPKNFFTNMDNCRMINEWVFRYKFTLHKKNYSMATKEAKKVLEELKKHLQNGTSLNLHSPRKAESDDDDSSDEIIAVVV